MKFDFLEHLYNLCSFDSDGGAGGGSEGSGEGGSEGSEGSEGKTPKTFTQEELNSILASEKRKNINSVYKDLGFDSVDEAKKYLEQHRQKDEDEKTELQKAQERVQALENEKAAESKKAQQAEYRLKVIESGCDAKNAEDVVVLAMSKVSEDKDFDAALKEVQTAHPSLFSDSSGDNSGTGSNGNNPRGKKRGSDVSGIGKRLAEQRKNSAKTNGFFND